MLGILLMATCRISAQSPYKGVVHPVPGIIQAEEFDDGGEGVGYHAVKAGNAGGEYRTGDMDVYKTIDTTGGYDVNLWGEEWLRYTVQVTNAGPYRVAIRLVPEDTPVVGEFRVLVDGLPAAEPIPAPSYVRYIDYTYVYDSIAVEPVILTAGVHVLQVALGRLESVPAGQDWAIRGYRLNYISVSPAAMRPTERIAGSGATGFLDGTKELARFSSSVTGIDVDPAGNVLVADAGNLRIRKVSSDGTVTTLAGNGLPGSVDGPGTTARFLTMDALATDNAGNCYVAEFDAARALKRLRLVAPNGAVSTGHEEPVSMAPNWEVERITGIAVRGSGNVVLLEQSTPLSDGTATTASLVELSGSSPSRTLLKGSRMSDHAEFLPPISSGHGSTVHHLVRNHGDGGLNSDVLATVSPGGSIQTTFLSRCSCSPRFTGLATAPDGSVYAAVDGAINQLLPDWASRTIRRSHGFSTVLASGYDGNLYAFEGGVLYRLRMDQPGTHLSAFSLRGGTVTPSEAEPYPVNAVVRLVANPAPNMQFMRWRGDAAGTDPALTLTMDTHKTVEAIFGAPVEIRSSEGGQVQRDPGGTPCAIGSKLSLVAKADPGFEFAGWSDGNSSPDRTIQIENPLSLKATFRMLPQFTVNALVLTGIGGTLSVTPEGPSYARDTVVTIVANPAPGYVFQTWLDNVQDNPRTFTIVSNIIAFAAFAPGTFEAPSIQSDLKDAVLTVGDRARLSVTAQGSKPLEYSWFKDGNPIPSEPGGDLVLAAADAGAAGIYKVVIRNRAGSVTSRSATIQTRGLAAYWPLNGDATEVGGSGLGGVIHGALRAGRALRFNGAGDYVAIPNSPSLDFSGAITMCAWVRPESVQGTQNILAHGYTLKPDREVLLRIFNGMYEVGSWVGEDNSYGAVLFIPPGDVGQWVHLAGSYDGVNWSLYRNGVLMNQQPQPVGTVPVPADWAIGARSGGTERFFKGMIDDVRIYNVALSPQQIAGLAANRPSGGAPAWLSIDRALPTGLRLRLEGALWSRYRVESSADLVAWSEITTIAVADESAPVYVDLGAPTPVQRYFRAVELP